MIQEEFLLPVIKRHTGDKKPGPDGVLRRMDNDICKKCHEEYQKKYPGKPFNVVCEGIFTNVDFVQLAKKTGLTVEEVREIYDPIWWAEKHIRTTSGSDNNDSGDISNFIPRNYQVPVLACTAERKVDRMGRGLGKTLLGVIEELHKITTKKNYDVLILAPAKAQAQKWFDDILWQCENDPALSECIKNKKQQPFYKIEFHNASTLSIFTAGSSSGRDADVIRSQSPRRVRLEEQDLLNEGDYKAVMPLLRRYKKTEFHGASTPTGARSQYWKMCTQFSDYREFYAPIMLDPNWSEEMEEACRREARTDDVYRHEFLAEFGDLAQGVFKSYHVDKARSNYRYKQCKILPSMKYYMGVDWNGQGTGTRIRVIQYDPTTKMRKMVDAMSVEGPQTTTQDSLDRIKDTNRYWHCEGIYIDKGFGFVQAEMLQLIGKKSDNADDKHLMEVKVIDFGAEIKTNKLVPNRGNSKYIDQDEEKRRTKPFMVEGAVMCIENGLFEFSDTDDLLDAQFRAYRVKTWSQHGFANTYDCGKEGDHDLDATMLALLGIELKYGITAQPRERRLAQIAHVAQLGGGPTNPVEGAVRAAESRKRAEEASQVPSRALPPKEDESLPKVVLPGQTSHIIIPGRAKDLRNGRVPSRTAAFRPPGDRTRVPSRTTPNHPVIGQFQSPQGNPFDNAFIAPRPHKGKPYNG
jgi:hypothetical protein